MPLTIISGLDMIAEFTGDVIEMLIGPEVMNVPSFDDAEMP